MLKPMINSAQIKWACRRGMLELDLILLPFFEQHFAMLNEGEQENFVALLNCSDQDLYGWFLQHNIPQEEKLKNIVKIICDALQNLPKTE